MSDNKGRKHTVSLVAVSSMEGMKAQELEAAVRAVGLSVVDAFEACEDPNLGADEKVARILDLDAASSQLTRLVDLAREEAALCSGPQRADADGCLHQLQEHVTAAQDALDAQRTVPYDPRTTVRAAENMLRSLEDTMGLLQASDRQVIARLHKMAEDATVIIEELTTSPPFSSRMTDAAQQFGIAIPTLLTSLERRLEILEDEDARAVITQSITEIRSGCGAVLSALRTGEAGAGKSAAEPLLDAIKRADDQVENIYKFYAKFKTEYFGTDLDVAMKQIVDAALMGDNAALARAAQKAYAEVASALCRAKVPKEIEDLVRVALGDVLRAAKACMTARTGAEAREAAQTLQTSVESLNKLISGLPSQESAHFVEEKTDLLSAARLLMKKGLPMLVTQLNNGC